MRKCIGVGVVVLCCVLSIAPRAASGAPILDQSFDPAYRFLYAQLSDLSRAQTFTAGKTGALTGLDLLISSLGVQEGTVGFSIYPTTAGLPNLGSAALASASFSLLQDTDTTWYSIDLAAAGANVTAGTLYAIVYASRVVGGNAAYWVGDYNPASPGEWGTDDYLGGSAYYLPVGGAWTSIGGDVGFRTWVEEGSTPPEVVPEPASLLTALTGVLGASWLARRRRR